jgi:hypothetical protein
MLLLLLLLAALVVLFLVGRSATHFAPFGSRLHVATIVSDTDNRNFQTLARVAGRHGTTITAITDAGPFGHGKGWGQRVRAMRRHLDTLPPWDVAMFIDGYDVIVAASPADILEGFKDLVGDRDGDVVVFNAESNCWPHQELAARYPQTSSPYKYLNGGGCIGRVDVFKRLLDRHMRFDDPDFDAIDDQGEFTKIFLHTHDIMLDTGNRIFNCMFAREGDLVRHDKGWFNTATRTYPLVFHANASPPKGSMLFTEMVQWM